MKRVEWAEHVASWKRSGESAESYGKPYKIPGKRLQWWNWFLKSEARTGRLFNDRERKKPAPTMELIPVTIRPIAPNQEIHQGRETEISAVEILVPNGSVIRAATAVDPGWLGKLIVAAGKSPC